MQLRRRDISVAETQVNALRHLVSKLARGYADAGRELAGLELTPAALEERLSSLGLGEAVLRDLAEPGSVAIRPAQIAVLGPTQVGKSTVVNLLLGQGVAKVSPLAGFTVQPQGFALEVAGDSLAWLDRFMAGLQRCTIEELSPDRRDVYGFASVKTRGVASIPSNCVIWDTPDFDSLSAHSYRRGVLDIVALADLIVLVLSKEKYSDLSVWKVLRLIQPLGRPLLVCLNKITADAEEAIVHSLQQRFASLGAEYSGVKIIVLPYQAGLDSLRPDQLPEAVEGLRVQVGQAVGWLDRVGRARGAMRFVREQWEPWTAPVLAEHAAQELWWANLENALANALRAYRRDYLEHSQRYDTFRRAVAELLVLLELPGLGKSLTRARSVLTWPARQIWRVGNEWMHKHRHYEAKPRPNQNEELVLQDVLGHLLTELTRGAARQAEPSAPAATWWRALSQSLIVDQQALTDTFREAVHRYSESFQPEIQAAANELYEILKESPALLNTLRAARATTDAAGVVLAVKTGGIGLNDLLLTPAMLSLTSMLTEGALGQYMRRVAEELKQRQYRAVRKSIFDEVVRPRLRKLGDALDAPGLIGISLEQFAEAERELRVWDGK